MKLGIKVIFIECDCKHFRQSTILDYYLTILPILYIFLDVVKVLGQIVNFINNTNNINNINNNMIMSRIHDSYIIYYNYIILLYYYII